MCTVTFFPRGRGYALGMNRDEKTTRPQALPPKASLVDGRSILYPSEPGGGTWIAVNDSGVTLALINWYSIPKQLSQNTVSRGDVITTAATAESPGQVTAALDNLPLVRINPFRLIGIFPTGNKIIEWRWDLTALAHVDHPWQPQQWISSGFDEPTAQRIRSQTFHAARRQKSVDTLPWLRRLHRSHSPIPGPFSTCMHRIDATTVSYTEIVVTSQSATMRYRSGPPCKFTRATVDSFAFPTFVPA